MTPHDYWNKPVEFIRVCWPEIRIYKKQRMILESVVENDETFVPAGNMLGCLSRLQAEILVTQWASRDNTTEKTSSAD